jgi:diguanylate cyclase (GGDEF)-like protein
MKIREIETTTIFKTLVRYLGLYRGDPTSQELEKLAEIRGLMLLVIKARWIFLVLLCAYGIYVGSLLISSRAEFTPDAHRLAILAGTLFAAATGNLFYHLFYRELSHFSLVNHVQILMDILVTTTIIQYSGGIFSPFWSIYPLLAMEASLLLEHPRDAWLFCIMASMAFGTLIAAGASDNLYLADTPFITEDLQREPLPSLLVWSWVSIITVAMTLIGSHVVRVNRRREVTLKQLVVKDQMTNLYNRSYFFKELNSEIQRSARYGRVFSVAFLDIDQFKEFNDTFGHLEGDRLLKELAGILRKNVRRRETDPPYDIDIPCRYGGEEFGIILPETPIGTTPKDRSSPDGMNAVAFAERIRKEIESMTVNGNSITVSIGIASFPQHGTSPDELVKSVDDALYRAKSRGKNRIVIAEKASDLDQKGTGFKSTVNEVCLP